MRTTHRPKPLIKYGKTGFDSKTHELWQKIAVVNDLIVKKAEKRGKTAKFGVKIVHNRKKVPRNSFITGFASESRIVSTSLLARKHLWQSFYTVCRPRSSYERAIFTQPAVPIVFHYAIE